mgnify:CR=1 FL=1
MIIEIDNREPQIIKEYFNNIFNNSNNSKNEVLIKLKNLDQGDFIIRNSKDNILLIIERKTIDDLLSSVKDNRYLEQSKRYTELDIPNNKIFYIIEGNYTKYKKESIEYKTIYSCLFSLNYVKGFTLLFTDSINGTCTIIEEYINKIIENKISSEYKLNLVKKQTITKENINYYMLNLVPGIGLETAKEILYNTNKSFYEFLKLLKNSEIDLESIKIKNRKLSKKIIENIKLYLI